MVAIETEQGRFEAESLKQAQALARKAEREAKRAQADRERRHKLASLRADATGFRILMLVAGLRGTPSYYWWKQFGTRFCRVTRGEHGDAAHYECEHGTGNYQHNGYRVLGVLADAGGNDIATFTQDMATGENYALAIGAEGDCLAFASLPPSITPQCFAEAERDSA